MLENFKGDKEKAIRNLTNSWYHECALSYPEDVINDNNEVEKSNLRERMMFAGWKIIQFYYSIYDSMSAVVRCFETKYMKNQKVAINAFNKILERSNFFMAPFNFYIEGNKVFFLGAENFDKGNMSTVERGLKKISKNRGKTFLLHFFKDLREWVTYDSSRVMIRFYHETPKGRRRAVYISRLDTDLKRICYAFNSMVEIFLINAFGWETIKKEFEEFEEQMKECLVIEPCSQLQERFDVYSKKFETTS
jgi:hypothetical protein